MMGDKLVFIYDGECPFCNHFAELLELKSNLQEMEIKDGRKNLSQLNVLLKKGFDIDNGAILIKGEEILHGYKAINWICGEIKDPSDKLLELLSVIFSSNRRASLLFPLLIWSRRFLLLIKGVPLKPL